MGTSSQTQLSAAIALSQLLVEHPDLAAARWSVERDGLLSGTVEVHAEYDMRETVRAYALVLGGNVQETYFTSPDGRRSVSVSLSATWRDVHVNVWGTCLVSALSAGSAVAA
ncbi:hypothetical protein [Streptomyces sp. AM6-12]|uniref:hypothetical protein n=1 Tax=Streptomyces sp. AM6-12 TaxID=3345149 RepID=UPI00379EE22A